MAKAVFSPILQLIRRVVEDQSARQLSDRHLLQQFTDQRDEAAFGTLLRRHGPMVLDVCRGVLGNEVDAEDAFQATFLILTRKAASIHKTGSVGSWLHGVAYRTALKARSQLTMRQKNEACAPARTISEPDDLTWREVRQVLHEELTGLAERYRVPLVACYLEGKTQDAAAAQLGLATSTLKERLERGRSLLRARLVRRGLGPTAVLVATAWPLAAASACLPATLVSSTIKAASLFAAGQAAPTGVMSVKVAALTEGLMKPMFLSKMKTALVVIVTVLGLGTCVGLMTGVSGNVVEAQEDKGKLLPTEAAKLRVQELIQRAKPAQEPKKKAAVPKLTQVRADQPALNKAEDGKEGRIYFWRDKRLASVQPDGKDLKWHSKVIVNAGGFPNVHLGHLRVSPDRRMVAFGMAGYSRNEDKTTDHKKTTRILRLDKEEPIIDLGYSAHDEWPWAPDGSKLAFYLLERKNEKAADPYHRSNWMIDVKTKKKTELRLPEQHTLTDLSHDGNWFLTESGGKKASIISLVKQDGSEARALTEPELLATRARFSPDGRMILFHGIDPKGKTKHIYAMDIQEKKPWKASQEVDGFVHGGCWSPDGKRIVYVFAKVSDEKGVGSPEYLFREAETFLMVVDADGKNSVTLFSEKKQLTYVTLWSADWR
jgi:RNA polymerase sigma factor (sigma-70 family)